jgi:hypothetical protein
MYCLPSLMSHLSPATVKWEVFINDGVPNCKIKLLVLEIIQNANFIFDALEINFDFSSDFQVKIKSVPNWYHAGTHPN